MTYRHPDLHMHSLCSDGSDSPAELLKKVRAAGIDIFSLTDHDTFLGCREIKENRKEGDPVFLGGIELSCKDEFGKYHILGYGYDIGKPSIRKAVETTHGARREKAGRRFAFLEDLGYTFTEEEKAAVLLNENPGKPHFADLLVKKGYVKSKDDAFTLLSRYHGPERRLTPEEAIDAILGADGIPILAHGLFEDGDGLLSEEEMDRRAARLKGFGLMGLECYHSSFSEEQSDFMLMLADRHNLMVTAGSDYHGEKKPVSLGQTGKVNPEKMERFYRAVKHLIG